MSPCLPRPPRRRLLCLSHFPSLVAFSPSPRPSFREMGNGIERGEIGKSWRERECESVWSRKLESERGKKVPTAFSAERDFQTAPSHTMLRRICWEKTFVWDAVPMFPLPHLRPSILGLLACIRNSN